MPLTLSKFCYLEDKSETLKDLSGEESRRWKDCCTTSDLRSWNTWFIIQDWLQNTISCDGKERRTAREDSLLLDKTTPEQFFLQFCILFHAQTTSSFDAPSLLLFYRLKMRKSETRRTTISKSWRYRRQRGMILSWQEMKSERLTCTTRERERERERDEEEDEVSLRNRSNENRELEPRRESRTQEDAAHNSRDTKTRHSYQEHAWNVFRKRRWRRNVHLSDQTIESFS